MQGVTFPEAAQASTNYPIAVLKNAPAARPREPVRHHGHRRAGPEGAGAGRVRQAVTTARQPVTGRGVGLPRVLWVPAALAFALIALPVVGLVLQANWARMPELLVSRLGAGRAAALAGDGGDLDRAVHRVRRAAGGGAGPRQPARPAAPALGGAAAAGAAAGGGRARAALPVGPQRAGRPRARPVVRDHRAVHRRRRWSSRRRSWRCRSSSSAWKGRCARPGSATRPSPRRSAPRRRWPSGGSPCRWCCRAWRRARCSRSPAASASSARPPRSRAACRAPPAPCRCWSTWSARPMWTRPSRCRWCWSSWRSW